MAARTGILTVGAGGRTILLPLRVNGRFLTGTGATATSGLRIFFHSCHINLHETLGLLGLTRTEHATNACDDGKQRFAAVFARSVRSVHQVTIRYQRTMKSLSRHPERHNTHRIGWLRAAVLGANDGVLSTSSLVIGIAASNVTHGAILISGVAGLVAGSMSMAAGEYVSVSSQSDTEKADTDVERRELAEDEVGERAELAAIYRRRGLGAGLAKEVARQLMEKDALGAHVRDELGISPHLKARPLQAAFTSAITFALGAAVPVVAVALAPEKHLIPYVAGVSLVFLAALGATAAKAGGAPISAGALRVTFWGALAMAVTAAVGTLFGVTT